ncbi:envelope glycoprotein C [Equid alphaherpesvirus 4]|uniref:16 n=2 Tax=Equid alphaherpesvirus 4 TaxID=10331 RepID=A0A288CG00_EHV4|nr:envelope glycoprotein C [Equid alphaherpesvirus 4]AAC59530.1 16 [Equid alphaherpesvirus 4]AMB16061.1 envelope glycoprotein C [Equid alphaherpesvirus 4]AMB16140.1 envelope glycoprotein C [Equid alphaherpesvirus 4]AMB16219.1 envelope glycoprotein C [Equid alphaherpesvirus 4]AMB16298.1 envelope glycoprotein C [Equid alphaherpesvirus 4]
MGLVNIMRFITFAYIICGGFILTRTSGTSASASPATPTTNTGEGTSSPVTPTYTTSTDSNNSTATNNSTDVNGTEATPTPSHPHSHENTITCTNSLISVPYYTSVTINCSTTVSVNHSEYRLEIHLNQRTPFSDTPPGDQENYVNHNATKDQTLLLFSTAHSSAKSRRVGQLGVIPDRLPKRQLFNLPAHTNGGTNFPLNIKSIDWRTAGVYVWYLFAKNGSLINSTSVTVLTYNAPLMDLSVHPSLKGENHRAVCVVASYFPHNSVKLRWYKNAKEVDFTKYVTNASSVWVDGLITRISTVSIPADPDEEYPPSLRCSIEWYRDEVSFSRMAKAGTPSVFVAPTVSVNVEDGAAVCTAECVPSNGVFVSWVVNDHLPGVPSQDVTTGVCSSHPGLVNMRSSRPLSEENGEREYNCIIEGYPDGLPMFSDSVVYDASPIVEDMPVLTSIIAVTCGAAALALVVLITAVCFYCSKPSQVPYKKADF